MDVKIVFPNRALDANIYVKLLISFEVKMNEHKVCRLKRSINGLKQPSR